MGAKLANKMKKVLLSLLLSSMFVGCGSPIAQTYIVQEPIQSEKRIKALVDSFISANPNYLNNEITQKEAASRLAHEFTALAQSDTLSCISDLPTQYYEMAAYKGDSLYVVKFIYPGFPNNDYVSEEYIVSYRVISILPKKEAIKLVDKQMYYLSGSFVSFLNMSVFLDVILKSGKPSLSVYDICGETPNDPLKVSALGNIPHFDFGTLIVENLKFNPVK